MPTAPGARDVPRRGHGGPPPAHLRGRDLAAKHRAHRAPGAVTLRMPRRNAPIVGSVDGEGTPASWLAASMAQMRIFVCECLASDSARVARKC